MTCADSGPVLNVNHGLPYRLRRLDFGHSILLRLHRGLLLALGVHLPRKKPSSDIIIPSTRPWTPESGPVPEGTAGQARVHQVRQGCRFKSMLGTIVHQSAIIVRHVAWLSANRTDHPTYIEHGVFADKPPARIWAMLLSGDD